MVGQKDLLEEMSWKKIDTVEELLKDSPVALVQFKAQRQAVITR